MSGQKFQRSCVTLAANRTNHEVCHLGQRPRVKSERGRVMDRKGVQNLSDGRVDVPAADGLVKMISPAPRAEWVAIMRSDPYALESQSPEWADAMCDAHPLRDASRLYVTAGGRTLVLPMLRRPLAVGFFTAEQSNPPACGLGGLLAAGGVQAGEVNAVLEDLAKRRVVVQSVSPGPLEVDAWRDAHHPRALVHPHHVHLLDLQGGWDEVWTQRFTKNSRRGVRTAERKGVTVERGTGGELVPEFYALMERAVLRWARQQHEPAWLARRRLHRRDPREKFEAIGRRLGDRFQVWVARVDGRPAAACLVARGVNAHDFRGAMDERLKHYRATDLIQARAIQDACEARCRYYYLGESGTGTLGQFKERFGARRIVSPEFRFERLPVTRVERGIKTAVKKIIGFQD
ncbi:GNAT family N-acetyltransferase [Amycolatopsis sp. NPDC051372]|uniref:GNAT family N-acetyltransferase n=1 Tax=Amycolatopsis sp. NPDC051372 TaxID=3155669 RepID=UPI003435B52B